MVKKILSFILTVLGVYVIGSHFVLTIDPDSCVDCGACQHVCPTNSISEDEVDGKDVYVIDPTTCTNCGACAEVCPSDAMIEIPYN
jgi:NAD-dependent dihydropyrimidine dehydrogenase PreA subunit